MRLIDADQIHHAKYHGIAEIYPSDVNIESYKRGWNDALDAVADPSCSPSIAAVPTASISRIEKELHGRDVEMQYEIIRWLWNYAKQFTDSRSAILQWLRGEES